MLLFNDEMLRGESGFRFRMVFFAPGVLGGDAESLWGIEGAG